MKREPVFASEAALCSAFSESAKLQGWTPYAETDGWDILLVAGDGTQIGVQAKLKFNLAVLHQAIEPDSWNSKTGPDFRAVLVPESGGWSVLCAALGITEIYCFGRGRRRGNLFEFGPALPSETDTAYWELKTWHYRNPEQRCPLPAYVPDVAAGISSPVQLTQWKIAALKIVACLEIRGFVTRDDFKRYGVDHRRWVVEDWLSIDGQGRYLAGKDLRFAQQHPGVYPKVLADTRVELSADIGKLLP